MSDQHDHNPDHGAHAPIQDEGAARTHERRVRALQSLLIDKGLITADEVRQTIEEAEARNPALGARVVARAWADPAFKARLLSDAKGAISDLGMDVSGIHYLVVAENSASVHHVVVCTLCSCYPTALLGRSPAWYKSLNYRARAASEPRRVLQEFGLDLPESVEVRVLDSTADMRYLVLPRRPVGTEHLSEEELARLVSRDSIIGVAEARAAEPAGVA